MYILNVTRSDQYVASTLEDTALISQKDTKKLNNRARETIFRDEQANSDGYGGTSYFDGHFICTTCNSDSERAIYRRWRTVCWRQH